MRSLYALLSMLIRENFIAGSFERVPEDSLVMDSQDQVEAWHLQGADNGPITPVYHLNARACSRLASYGSTVVDLGCGSGQFAAYLAQCRPDLHIVGIDLSGPMVKRGNDSLRAAGLGDQVELYQGDMTSFSRQSPQRVGLINCLFAMHHLPSLGEVELCLREIRKVVEKDNGGIMLFDLARPRHKKTAKDYPRALTPDAPNVFQLDSINSLLAAFQYAEVSKVVYAEFGSAGVNAVNARLLPLYQAFWRKGQVETNESSVTSDRLDGKGLAPIANVQYRLLRSLLPGLPQ